MKRLILAVILMVTGYALYAQSEKSIENRLTDVETSLNNQNVLISNLQREVYNVTKQNLALKGALFLQPTIAEVNTDEFSYKLHEAIGDSTTHEVHLHLTITNTTPNDLKDFFVQKLTYVNEYGNQNASYNGYKLDLGGVNDCKTLDMAYSKVPILLDITLTDYNPNSLYIKILDIDIRKGQYWDGKQLHEHNRAFIMRNIPSTWK